MKIKKDLIMKKIITFNSWYFNELITKEEYILLRYLLKKECYGQILRLNKKNLYSELKIIKDNYDKESCEMEVI